MYIIFSEVLKTLRYSEFQGEPPLYLKELKNKRSLTKYEHTNISFLEKIPKMFVFELVRILGGTFHVMAVG